MNTEWWNPPKPTVCVPINVFGDDDEAYQTSVPDEMFWDEAKKKNRELFTCKSTWWWFWAKDTGSDWRMAWEKKAAIGPMEEA